ncbi:MAG: O-antigen polysaccharide polymerase Wzy family protein [Actinomycetia bacterium]|nr:O-antigen polysaccharide polymerase Wzy family protein [Actinomycetes bacterium]
MLIALQFLTFFLSLASYSAWLMVGGYVFLECALLSLFAFCLLFAVMDFRRRFVLVMFLSSFFLFLLSSVALHVFGVDAPFMGVFPGFFNTFSSEVVATTLNLLFISLLALLLGFVLGGSGPHSGGFVSKPVDVRYQTVVSEVSRVLFFVTIPAGLMRVLVKVLFVQSLGYLASYTSYAGAGPLLEKLAVVNTVCFFIFLGTMPGKRAARLPIYAYLVINGMTLFSGVRNDAVIAVLLVTVYYIYRSTLEERQKRLSEPGSKTGGVGGITTNPWVSGHERRLAVGAMTGGVVLLSYWSYYRVGLSVEHLSILGLFLEFFKAQGGSINVIAHGVNLASYLPSTNVSYVFGPVISWVNSSILSELLGGSGASVAHTVDMAFRGNNFGQTITYLVMPTNYLAGVGMGSSYIAELFVDFGYSGVVVYNLLLGFTLSRFSRMSERVENPFVFAAMMLALQGLLFLPRDVALAWLTNLLNFTTLATFVLVSAVVSIRMHREGS